MFLSVAASNPLTVQALFRTLLFQIGIIGFGTLALSTGVISLVGLFETRAARTERKIRKALILFAPYLIKGIAFIFLTGTLTILLTDVGWPQAISRFGLIDGLVLARASGAPNGAHLLSYIPLPLLGLYVAWKWRKDVLLDCFQGIILVGFGVAFHELPWLGFYWLAYAHYWNLGVLTNVLEDIGFSIMCSLLVIAWWKYPQRTIPMKAFLLPLGIYIAMLVPWFVVGLPITTINNWQLGSGVFEITPYWGNIWVNLIEIASWVEVAALFFVVVHASKTVRS